MTATAVDAEPVVAVDVVAAAARIAATVAAPNADAVDAEARFPIESITALGDAGLMSCLVPVHLGGFGSSIAEVAAVCRELGRACSSTAMVFAMHQIQVASLVNHGKTPLIEGFLREVVRDRLLLASATTELGVGGDTRSSLCAVVCTDDHFTLEKQAPVISYGRYADAILATARTTPDSAASDQVLVLCRRSDTELEQRGEWDTLGFRGTCSPGFRLEATGPLDAICADPYAEILSETMLPVSHLLWGSLWLGIADAAMRRARKFVQGAARSKPGTIPPGAGRLAELLVDHQRFEGLVSDGVRRYESALADPDFMATPSYGIAMNTLKVAASQAVIDIVSRAMTICGIAGYVRTSPYSLGRQLRDAHGAAVMVNNDRILANTASQVLMQRDA